MIHYMHYHFQEIGDQGRIQRQSIPLQTKVMKGAILGSLKLDFLPRNAIVP